jgi:hypothetical protein
MATTTGMRGARATGSPVIGTGKSRHFFPNLPGTAERTDFYRLVKTAQLFKITLTIATAEFINWHFHHHLSIEIK